MKKSELQEKVDKQTERVKRQNESAKERWDTVSCRLPKGTKDRIKKLGLSINGYINALVLDDLERLEHEPEPKDLNVIGMIED